MAGGDVVGIERRARDAVVRSTFVDEDVGRAEENVEPGAPGSGGWIDRRAALVRVAVPVRGRRVTASAGERAVAAGRLDADDVGAEVAEDARAERAAEVGEVDHPQAGERPSRLAVRARLPALPHLVGSLPSRPSMLAHRPRRTGPEARGQALAVTGCRVDAMAPRSATDSGAVTSTNQVSLEATSVEPVAPKTTRAVPSAPASTSLPSVVSAWWPR